MKLGQVDVMPLQNIGWALVQIAENLVAGPALALSAVVAVHYWLRYAASPGHSWQRSLVKTMSLAPLAAAWLFAVLAPWRGGETVMALGLALGVAGDFFLSRPGERAFLAGMAAFGLGHLAYAMAMLAQGGEPGLNPLTFWHYLGFALLAWLVLSTEFWLAPHTGALRWPVRAYVLLIGAMAVAAILLPAQPGQAALRVGAVLFLLSDLLLSVRLFVSRDPRRNTRLDLALWPAYVAGQMLIYLGATQVWAIG